MFLFLARLKFHAQDSIIKILRRRHGDGLIKKVRNLRNLILNIENLYWIWSFCSHARKSLQFKVANKRLESSEAYLSWQRRLLNQELSTKYKTIRTLK